MANYNSKFTSNYFQVTDEEKFRNIIDHIVCEDKIEIDFDTDKSGNTVFAVCGYGNMDGYAPIKGEPDYDEDYEGDWDEMIKQLQSVLPDGETMIINSVGNEKLRYVDYYCLGITNKDNKIITSAEVNHTVNNYLKG